MYAFFVGAHSFSRWLVCAQSFSRFSCFVLSISLFRKSTHSDTALSLTSLCRLFLSLCMWHSSQIQIVATCLDVRNVSSLPGIPPREVEAAWMEVKDMLVVLIDETRAADESMRTYVTNHRMASQSTGLRQHLRLLLTLSTSQVPTLPTKTSPCAWFKHCRHKPLVVNNIYTLYIIDNELQSIIRPLVQTCAGKHPDSIKATKARANKPWSWFCITVCLNAKNTPIVSIWAGEVL